MPIYQTRRSFLALGASLAAALPFANAEAADTPLRIGIVGAGHIGSTLGTLWVKNGHEVMFASRHPEELKPLVDGLGPKAKAGTPDEAIAFGDVVFLAIPYKAYPEFAKDHGAALKGKIVLDAGNATKARDGDLFDEVQAKGIGITSQSYLAGTRLVRAFNAANYKVFAKEGADGGQARAGRMAIPIAGDDADALRVAETLVRDAGFEPVVVGPLKDAGKFAMGAPAYGQDVTAPELRQALGLAK